MRAMTQDSKKSALLNISSDNSYLKAVSCTHHMSTVTAKAPLACLQYPTRSLLIGGPQLLVMYHGAPGCGCFGSLMSGAA